MYGFMGDSTPTYGVKHYVVDTINDVHTIYDLNPVKGTTVYIIEKGKTYIFDGKLDLVPYNNGSSSSSGGSSSGGGGTINVQVDGGDI